MVTLAGCESAHRGRPVGGSGYNVAVTEPRDEFPNNFVGDLVPTERCWVIVPQRAARTATTTTSPAGRSTQRGQLPALRPGLRGAGTAGAAAAPATACGGTTANSAAAPFPSSQFHNFAAFSSTQHRDR